MPLLFKSSLTALTLLCMATALVAHQLTVHSYDELGNNLPSVEVVATDASGSTKLNTDVNGIAVFNKTGNTELRFAKDNHLGAKQIFVVNSDTTLKTPLINKEYTKL